MKDDYMPSPCDDCEKDCNECNIFKPAEINKLVHIKCYDCDETITDTEMHRCTWDVRVFLHKKCMTINHDDDWEICTYVQACEDLKLWNEKMNNLKRLNKEASEATLEVVKINVPGIGIAFIIQGEEITATNMTAVEAKEIKSILADALFMWFTRWEAKKEKARERGII